MLDNTPARPGFRSGRKRAWGIALAVALPVMAAAAAWAALQARRADRGTPPNALAIDIDGAKALALRNIAYKYPEIPPSALRFTGMAAGVSTHDRIGVRVTFAQGSVVTTQTRTAAGTLITREVQVYVNVDMTPSGTVDSVTRTQDVHSSVTLAAVPKTETTGTPAPAPAAAKAAPAAARPDAPPAAAKGPAPAVRRPTAAKEPPRGLSRGEAERRFCLLIGRTNLLAELDAAHSPWSSPDLVATSLAATPLEKSLTRAEILGECGAPTALSSHQPADSPAQELRFYGRVGYSTLDGNTIHEIWVAPPLPAR